MDFKTIILIILIICIIGAIIFLGIKIMNTPTTPKISDHTDISNNLNNDSDIVPSPSPRVQNTTNINNPSSDVENTIQSNEGINFSKEQLTQIYGTGLIINNNNPQKEFDVQYYDVGLSMEGNTKAFYSVPANWNRIDTKAVDPDSGANVTCECSKTSSFIDEVYEETTYEDVLNGFIERERNNSQNPNSLQFYTRELTNDGGTYTVLIKNDGFATTSYLIYIKDLYEYHLAFTSSTEAHEGLTNVINNIFNSFKIR